MTPSALHWENQRVFLAVLRTGSLSGAARLLGIAQATARRRIEALEHSVGVSLFIRSPTGLTPTENARELVGYAESMALAAEAFTRAASAPAQACAGTVRLTAGRLLGVEVLPALLHSLRQAHPQLALELSVSNRLEALSAQEADVAVRIRRPKEEALVVRHVGDLRVGLYVAPRLLMDTGDPQTLDDLRRLPLIGPDRNLVEIAFLSQRGYACSPADTTLRTDDHLAQFALLRAGLGVGMCAAQLAKQHGLVRILPHQVDFRVDVWVAMHRDLRRVQRVATVFKALAQALADYLAGDRSQ